ncbi:MULTISPECIES: hypothetical protein [unclassified Pseudovibrio]|uniref:hypothetical protein n=1 Tax=unclassified Pseudovibrio TaxID=2627060 RepID=UPI0007AE9C4D|nr:MULTISPECIES: hypothetical protein [unclassified Pseudovibrio]KZL03339.1 hypothetical protein PsW74_00765 [Pseudovibrio sp. W74]KZL12207.1 hypothetical protein PsAD14_00374 [Pseudovibrio sp. Ad14]
MQELRFHHVGIPTSEKLPETHHNKTLKFTATGYFEGPYAIEWMNFDDDNPLPEIIKTTPHVAYVVDDLTEALQGKNVILSPESPAKGVWVAFILEGRNLIELMQFDKPEEEIWPHPGKFRI